MTFGGKKWAALLLAGVMVVAAGCGGGSKTSSSGAGTSGTGGGGGYTPEKPLVVKFSHVTTPDSPKGVASLKFAELVAQRTGNKVKVEVYPSSQLYGDKEELDALQAANVHIIAPSAAKLVGMNKQFQIIDMPFLFRDDVHSDKFFDSELGAKLLNSMDKNNIKGLAFWENGYKHFTNSKRPIKSPADMEGLKFRTQAGKVLEAQFKAVKAGSATIPFGETYAALQQGTVDGQENTFNNIDTQKYQEVQKYMTVSYHGRIDYAVLTNKKWWDGLPEDIRKIMEDTMKEVSAFERKLAREMDKKSLENLKKAGKMEIYELNAQEKEAFAKAMEPVFKEFEPVIGKELLDGVKKL